MVEELPQVDKIVNLTCQRMLLIGTIWNRTEGLVTRGDNPSLEDLRSKNSEKDFEDTISICE